jgi:hypothetical protein
MFAGEKLIPSTCDESINDVHVDHGICQLLKRSISIEEEIS